MLNAAVLLQSDFAHMFAKYAVPCDLYCLSRTCKTLMNIVGSVCDMNTYINSIVYDRSLMITKLLTDDMPLHYITSDRDNDLIKTLLTDPDNRFKIVRNISQLLFDSGYFARKDAYMVNSNKFGPYAIKPFHVENINLYLSKENARHFASPLRFNKDDSDTIIRYCEYTDTLKYFTELVCEKDKFIEFITENYEVYPKICKLLLGHYEYYFRDNMSQEFADILWRLDKHASMSVIPPDMAMELNKKTITITLKTQLHSSYFQPSRYWNYLMSDKCKISSINDNNMYSLLSYRTPDMLSEIYEKKGKRWSKVEQRYAMKHMRLLLSMDEWDGDGTYNMLVRANELGLTNIPDADLWYHLKYPGEKYVDTCNRFMANIKLLLDIKAPLPNINDPRFKRLAASTRDKLKDIIIGELLAKLA